jgi:hypothetical protein
MKTYRLGTHATLDRSARLCEVEKQMNEISGPASAALIPDRERLHTKQLQQRLEQLVAVHRQVTSCAC